MGDIISHLKKSKQYFVCTMGLKAYSCVLTQKLFFAWFDFSCDGGWGVIYKYLKKINENYYKNCDF